MGLYRTICFKVEDIFITMMTRKQNSAEVKEKVEAFRNRKAIEKERKRFESEAKLAEQRRIQEKNRAEQERLRKEREVKEKIEIEALLTKVIDVENMSYTQYEYNEVRKNKPFFQALHDRVFEENESGLTFLHCEFDKSKKKEIKGYLVVTNKRVLFLTKDLNHIDKFRYQTIINVSWFKDGLIERGLYIQYGKRKLEFDEIYDTEQMKRVGDLILRLSSKSSHSA